MIGTLRPDGMVVAPDGEIVGRRKDDGSIVDETTEASLRALSFAAKLQRLSLELAAQCSQREQGGGAPLAADLQPVLLWLPLLQQALRRLRSPELHAWQVLAN